MQQVKKYYIKELEDKTKKIKIVSFYDDSVLYFGDFGKVPSFFMNCPYKIFTPYENHYEFIL